jgi:hypothetical protein
VWLLKNRIYNWATFRQWRRHLLHILANHEAGVACDAGVGFRNFRTSGGLCSVYFAVRRASLGAGDVKLLMVLSAIKGPVFAVRSAFSILSEAFWRYNSYRQGSIGANMKAFVFIRRCSSATGGGGASFDRTHVSIRHAIAAAALWLRYGRPGL